MSDDIVTRLQNECQCSDDCRSVNDPCIPMQAADGIERLNYQIANLKAIGNQLLNAVRYVHFSNEIQMTEDLIETINAWEQITND